MTRIMIAAIAPIAPRLSGEKVVLRPVDAINAGGLHLFATIPPRSAANTVETLPTEIH